MKLVRSYFVFWFGLGFLERGAGTIIGRGRIFVVSQNR